MKYHTNIAIVIEIETVYVFFVISATLKKRPTISPGSRSGY